MRRDRTLLRLLPLALVVNLGLAGCPGPSEPPDGGPQIDAGGMDAGSGCAEDSRCAGATPICEVESGECVECVEDEACAETAAPTCLDGFTCGCAGDEACAAASAGTPHCDLAGAVCVRCTEDSHCADVPETPRCDPSTRQCAACVADEDCTDADLPRCDEDAHVCATGCGAGECARFAGEGRGACGSLGICVECGAEDASACAGSSTCDLLTETCTGAPPDSADICEACTNDEQCPANHRCVMTRYMGSGVGYFCLKQASFGCDRPFFLTGGDRNSINGASAESYCGPAEDRTTCEAMLAVDTPCGDGCPTGGRCETVAGSGTVCTYDCVSDLECPPTALQIGTCGEVERYCGG